MNGKLNINTVYQVYDIFTALGWHREEGNELFKRYCTMLGHFSNEQQALILELTHDFLSFGIDDYAKHLRNCLSQVEPQDYNGVTRVYLVPLQKPVDFGKSKSPGLVAYLLGGHVFADHEVFRGRKISVIDKLDQLRENIEQISCMVFLVDDFVGTGDTAEDVLVYLNSESGIPKSKMNVLCIAAQEAGLARLKAFGVKAYCSVVRKKGITDKYASPTREHYLDIMRTIEDLLNVSDRFRFGYKGSEALVSLIRTPNNTFPVFWHESKLSNGNKFIAPFPR